MGNSNKRHRLFGRLVVRCGLGSMLCLSEWVSGDGGYVGCGPLQGIYLLMRADGLVWIRAEQTLLGTISAFRVRFLF